jgi:GntR family transcriptional regulator
VYRFNRIRYADDMPMCLEYATIAASALPSLDAVDTSMYEALEAAGKRPVRALQRLSALLLNAEQAKLLQSKEGDAGLCVERLGFLPDGQAVEFCRSYFRGDMYDFVAELSAAINLTSRSNRHRSPTGGRSRRTPAPSTATAPRWRLRPARRCGPSGGRP